jgi:protein phosphatase
MTQDTETIYGKFSIVGEATSVGRVRKANEDSKAVIDAGWIKIFTVCDGMGGHVGGKIASETAIAAISDYFLNNIAAEPCEAIHNAIVAANNAILNRAGQQPELTGMGSTCVMLALTSDGKVYYGHVGDSRIYIIANHRITQLTKDHSVVQMMFDEGVIKNKEDMEHHPRKNEITNALGMYNMQPPTICCAPIEPEAGNCFLLCSDGLTGMVNDGQILRVVSKHEIPIQQRAETLVQMANDNGGVDNITVELVEFPNSVQDIVNGGQVKPFIRKNILIFALPALVILGGIAWYILTQVLKPKPGPEDQAENIGEAAKRENKQEIEWKEYTADVIKFEKNKKSTANIPGFPKDTVIQDSIKWDTRYVKKITIEQACITLEWLKETPPKSIEVSCETSSGKKCRIMIPVNWTIVQPKEKKQIPLNTVTCELETWIPVEIPDTIDIEKGQIVNTTPKTVSCEITGKHTFNIKFLKGDCPNPPVKVTIDTDEKIYTFVIPVKKPESPIEEEVSKGDFKRIVSDKTEDSNSAPTN